MNGRYDDRRGVASAGCLNKSLSELSTDGMTYNLVKNKLKALVSSTSMSGKYPDGIRCGFAIFHIQSIDDANKGVTYRSLAGVAKH